MKYIFNSSHTMKTRRNCVVKLTTVVLFTMLSMSPVSAADQRVDSAPTDDLIALSLCRAYADPDKNESDHDVIFPGGNMICCSQELGWCIECTQDVDEACTRTEYSKRPVRFQKPTLTTPADRVIAPVKPMRPTAKGTLKTTPRKLKLN